MSHSCLLCVLSLSLSLCLPCLLSLPLSVTFCQCQLLYLHVLSSLSAFVSHILSVSASLSAYSVFSLPFVSHILSVSASLSACSVFSLPFVSHILSVSASLSACSVFLSLPLSVIFSQCQFCLHVLSSLCLCQSHSISVSFSVSMFHLLSLCLCQNQFPCLAVGMCDVCVSWTVL